MILARLRSETRELHARVEQSLDLPRRLASLGDYAAMLSRYYGFYAPVEQLLRSVLAVDADLSRLSKTNLLQEDLAALGLSGSEIAALPRCAQMPALPNAAAAWGCLYVLEGATLGGQVIRRELERALPQTRGRGCGFLSAYGTRVGEMWKSFCGALTVYESRHPGSADPIVEGAVETFTCFEEWVAC